MGQGRRTRPHRARRLARGPNPRCVTPQPRRRASVLSPHSYSVTSCSTVVNFHYENSTRSRADFTQILRERPAVCSRQRRVDQDDERDKGHEETSTKPAGRTKSPWQVGHSTKETDYAAESTDCGPQTRQHYLSPSKLHCSSFRLMRQCWCTGGTFGNRRSSSPNEQSATTPTWDATASKPCRRLFPRGSGTRCRAMCRP